MPDPTIRAATAADFDAWLPLWRGYQAFYKTDIPHDTTLATWQRLLAPDEPMHVALAELRRRRRGACPLHRAPFLLDDR